MLCERSCEIVKTSSRKGIARVMLAFRGVLGIMGRQYVSKRSVCE